jgi:uncharacterized protein YggE
VKKSAIAFGALALSLVAATVAPATAQYGPQPTQGVTVSGHGVIAVPADSLRFQLVLHVAPSTSLDEVGKAVAQTLRQNGVPDAT